MRSSQKSIKRLARDWSYLLLSHLRVEGLYKLCKFYIHAFDGENCSDPNINGEYQYSPMDNTPVKVIFDVGANDGQYSRRMLERYPLAEIHMFEPDPLNIDHPLVHSLGKGVRLNCVALGSNVGTATLNQGGVLSSFHTSDGANPKIEVSVTTIDEYCRENQIEFIDYIKMDVEGHELEVLRGMRLMLSKSRVSQIQFEYGNPSHDADVSFYSIFSFLQSFNANFQLKKITNRGLQSISYSRKLEFVEYANFLAVMRP